MFVSHSEKVTQEREIKTFFFPPISNLNQVSEDSWKAGGSTTEHKGWKREERVIPMPKQNSTDWPQLYHLNLL